MKHISHCEACWEVFMNLGVGEEPPAEVVTSQKRQFFSKVTDPAFKGDHRMEQFQLLSTLHFTSYARQVFLEYFTRLEEGRPEGKRPWSQALARLEDGLYEKLQYKKRERQDPEAPIDAEVMLSALDELGEPSVFLRHTATQPAASAPARRIYRSTQDKMIGGVCGGLGEYFRLDPILLRILFVAFFFFGGSSVLLYAVLFVVLPVRLKPQPIFSEGEGQAWDAAQASSGGDVRYSGVTTARRLLIGFSAAVLFCLYIPLLFVLGMASVACSVSIFYFPGHLIPPGSFGLSGVTHLSQLGLPGVLAGGSLSLLFFSLFLLVLSFVLRLHFKKAFLGKGLQTIFVVFLVMGFFSSLVSAGLIFSAHKSDASATFAHSFPLPKGNVMSFDDQKFAPLLRSEIFIDTVSIRTRPGQQKIGVKVTLHARGGTISQSHRSLKQLVVSWGSAGESYFPTIQKRGGPFHFEYANIELTIPESLSLEINQPPAFILVQGNYGEVVSISSTEKGRVHLQQVRAKKIQLSSVEGILKATKLQGQRISISGDKSLMVLRQLRAPRIELQQEKGRTTLFDILGETLTITKRDGKLKGERLSGILNFRNERGSARLKLSGLSSQKNKIVNVGGKLRVYFPKDGIPRLKVTRHKTRMRTRAIENKPTTDALLTIDTTKGKIRLLLWDPSYISSKVDGGGWGAPVVPVTPTSPVAPVVPRRSLVVPSRSATLSIKAITRDKTIVPRKAIAPRAVVRAVVPAHALPRTAPTSRPVSR